MLMLKKFIEKKTIMSTNPKNVLNKIKNYEKF